MKKKFSLIVFLILLLSGKSFCQGTWSNLDGGINLDYGIGVLSICPDSANNILYAGGWFDSAGSYQQYGFAKWNGTTWDTTTSFSDEKAYRVNAMIMYKGQLVVGFNEGQIGVYNGTTFKFDKSLPGNINCFCIYNDTLYAGGSFIDSFNTVAKLKGSKWVPVDKGMTFNYCCAVVNSMVVYNGSLIAAGQFDSAGSVLVNSIASYNGTKWSALGYGIGGASGFPGYIYSVEVYNNHLYAGGEFISADSIPANNIAVWNGTVWDSLPSNPNTYINALKAFDGYLFIGAEAGFALEYVYKFDGSITSTVDSGLNSDVWTLNTWNGALYVGGAFDTAGNKLAARSIARWTPDTTTTSLKYLTNRSQQLSVFPNPTTNQLTINSNQFAIKEIEIENVLGQKVLLITPQPPKGGEPLHVDVSGLPAGIYFYRVTENNSHMVSGKFIKQ